MWASGFLRPNICGSVCQDAWWAERGRHSLRSNLPSQTFYSSTKLLTRSRIYVRTSRHWTILNSSSDLECIPSLPTGSRASKWQSSSLFSRLFLSDPDQPICIGLDRIRHHIWQYLVVRIHVRGLCDIERHSHWHHGLHQTCVLRWSSGKYFLTSIIWNFLITDA